MLDHANQVSAGLSGTTVGPRQGSRQPLFGHGNMAWYSVQTLISISMAFTCHDVRAKQPVCDQYPL